MKYFFAKRMSNITDDEKNIFLQDLEEEQKHKTGETSPQETQKHKTRKKGMGATAIFAAFSILFIFIILLMIFLLSIAGTGNPVFKTFGIQPYEIKAFLTTLLHKSFLIIIVGLLIATAIGVFRGYAIPKNEENKKKRRDSFLFASVAGGLIFLSLLSWGGAYAFINKTVTEMYQDRNAIEIIDIEQYGETLIAPIDIGFSIEKTIKGIQKRGFTIESIKWSSDGGKNFLEYRSGEKRFFHFTQKGFHEIAVSILLKNGEEQIFYRSFTIKEATFSVPNKIHAKQKTIFDARALIDGGKKYQWDFDEDGIYEESSSKGLISHTFKKPGTFNVQLRVTLPLNGYEIFTRKIRVYSESEDSIVAEISSPEEFSGQAPLTLHLSGDKSFTEEGKIVKYTWTIGKQRIKKKGKEIQHIFKDTGQHHVKLSIENDFGETADTEITVEVSKGNSPPKAEISSLPPFNKQDFIKGKTPLEIKFSGEESTDSDENITEYLWKIENRKNGEKIEFHGSTLNHNFREEGEYIVTLTVIDSKGEKSSKKIQVIMTEPSVIATAHFSPEFGSAPLIVNFDASESSCKSELCSVTGFMWDFKDGSPIKRSGAKISHRFEKEGSYPVEVTIQTNTGESNSKTLYVNVSEPEFNSCFSSSRMQGVAPVKISFDPSCSEGKISEYKWDFGDGYISQSKRPSHTFREAGEFTITLYIINADKRVSESTKTITIRESNEDE